MRTLLPVLAAVIACLGLTSTGARAHAATGPTSRDSSWPQGGYGPGQLGDNPTETTLGTTEVTGLSGVWSQVLGRSSSPVEADGEVFATSQVHLHSSVLYALDAASGARRWSVPLRGTATTPALVDHLVIVGTASGAEALNEATGARVWTSSMRGGAGSPTVADGVVYVGSGNGVLIALRATTGARMWASPAGGVAAYAPAVDRGVVLTTVDNSPGSQKAASVVAFRAGDGSQIWTKALPHSFSSNPSVGGGVAYLTSGGVVEALAATTGGLRWSTQLGAYMAEESALSPPAVAAGRLYVGAGSQTEYALDAQTGAVVWTGNAGGDAEVRPAVADGVVYVGAYQEYRPSGSVLSALDAATGDTLWSSQLFGDDPGAEPQPIVVDGSLLATGLGDAVEKFCPNGSCAATH